MYSARKGFPSPTNKWKHSGIHKEDNEDRPSVFRQVSNFVRSVADDVTHPIITWNAWKNRNRRGGKNKSRKSGKSRKNRKTRSRKNRKTRSRK